MSELPFALPPPINVIQLCFTPIFTMANGLLIMFIGIILQFAAILRVISVKLRPAIEINQKKHN
ncbi:hypothetical protein L6303_04700 [archaeon]|nr:hypothetical protein [archaeon]